MERMPGESAGRPAYPHEVGSLDGRLIGLLDLLLNNRDRHPFNWLVLDDHSIVAIDHGLSDFRHDAGKIDDAGLWPWNDFTEQYLERRVGGGTLAENDWHPDDLQVIKRRLEALFETDLFREQAPLAGPSYGSGVNPEIILGRLYAVWAKATGTVRRLT